MLVLASQSPRRKEIMELVGLEFQCVPSRYEEDMSLSLSPEELTEALAKAKAEEVLARRGEDVVIGSDTVVAVGNEILGKPKDSADAARMLRSLSGKTHRVVTGVAICSKAGSEVFSVSTDVEFYPLTEEQIAWYVSTNEPNDKAGAYAIQGKGTLLVKGIRGDYYNVVGLPIAELARRLKKYNIGG